MSENNFKYELLFELSPDLLCIAGFDGYFKKINPAVSKLLGYSMEELYSRPINDIVFQDDKEITARVRKDLTESIPLLNFENRYVTKTGEIVWLSWTSLPVPEDRLIFAIAKNITHKKIQEEERNALLADLSKVNKDLKQLNYTASHDLRSPVNNLLSIINLFEVSELTDPGIAKLISVLKLTADRVRETLDNYVDVLNEKHTINDKIEEVDLPESLAEVLQSINSLIQTSGAVIDADFSNLGIVRFNKVYMGSVFLNLITNSIKYAQPGIPPVIKIYSEKTDGGDQLVISDNGLGFDLEKVKGKIFGLHQKFHNHVDSKGIGLYLVYNHVTGMGGQINVESKVNVGTTFVITLKE